MATPCSAMPLAQEPLHRRSGITVSLASSEAEIEQCLRLRYRVFADEMGAALRTTRAGIDQDRFDPYCKHLMVRDTERGEVIGTTRLLLSRDAAELGMFYSETEFDLGGIRALPGQFMEVGRTCIHPDYRRGAALAMLWNGVAQVTVLDNVDYLIGCASIPLNKGDSYVVSILEYLRTHHWAPEALRVSPLIGLNALEAVASSNVLLPPLLKGYLRLGAVVCGEPYWDAAFNVADAFILVDRDQLARRYVRHFVNRV